MLLRDAVRVLPDCQVGSMLKHVLRAELLLVLANDPDNRVRTALIKVHNFSAQLYCIISVSRHQKNEIFHNILCVYGIF